MITYPLNKINYDAESAELYNCTRNSGVYSGDDFRCSVTGTDNNVTVSAGVGWIRNSKFSGKVVAEKSPKIVDLGITDPSLDRIDVVLIQFDKVQNKTEIVVKKGTTSSKPIMPAVVQTESIYELYLCKVYRRAGFAAISAGDVTDLRMDKSVCGLMADSITSVDTDAVSKQITQLIKDLNAEIQGVKDGSAFLLRSGGTMRGILYLGNNPLRGLPIPTQETDAVPKNYLEDYVKKALVREALGIYTYNKSVTFVDGRVELSISEITGGKVKSIPEGKGAVFATNSNSNTSSLKPTGAIFVTGNAPSGEMGGVFLYTKDYQSGYCNLSVVLFV